METNFILLKIADIIICSLAVFGSVHFLFYKTDKMSVGGRGLLASGIMLLLIILFILEERIFPGTLSQNAIYRVWSLFGSALAGLLWLYFRRKKISWFCIVLLLITGTALFFYPGYRAPAYYSSEANILAHPAYQTIINHDGIFDLHKIDGNYLDKDFRISSPYIIIQIESPHKMPVEKSSLELLKYSEGEKNLIPQDLDGVKTWVAVYYSIADEAKYEKRGEAWTLEGYETLYREQANLVYYDAETGTFRGLEILLDDPLQEKGRGFVRSSHNDVRNAVARHL